MPQSSFKGWLRRIPRSLSGGSDPCLAGDGEHGNGIVLTSEYGPAKGGLNR